MIVRLGSNLWNDIGKIGNSFLQPIVLWHNRYFTLPIKNGRDSFFNNSIISQNEGQLANTICLFKTCSWKRTIPNERERNFVGLPSILITSKSRNSHINMVFWNDCAVPG